MRGWTPRIRGEWRHEFNATDSQQLDYAGVTSLRYQTRGVQWRRDAYSIDLGRDIALGGGWQFIGEVGAGAGSGAIFGTGKAAVRKQF